MMSKNKMRPIHPGEILNEELEARGLSRAKFARVLGVSPRHVTGLLTGQCAVTAGTALRLARCFDSSAEMWMALQSAYELRVAETTIGKEIDRTVKRAPCCTIFA